MERKFHLRELILRIFPGGGGGGGGFFMKKNIYKKKKKESIIPENVGMQKSKKFKNKFN